MKLVFDDQTLSYETLRAASYTPYDGAEIGEILATANRITPGDAESWWGEWNATAERVDAIGRDCAERGHAESARRAHLRASNYYRTAEFFLRDDPTGERAIGTWRRGVEAFDRAIALVGDRTWTRVEIPYEDTVLPGILYTVDDSGAPRPTLLFCGGYDSTLEELYFAGAAAALRHGWNCLTFAGPGQGSVIREQGLTFRPDWEAVVTPVVDFAATLSAVDMDRLALMGMSLGGYFAPRAAAFEPRIKALIAFDGLYDMSLFARTLAAVGTEDDDYYRAMRTDIGLDWLLRNGMWTLGVGTPSKVGPVLADYHLRGIAERITASTLVLEAENDHFSTGQPEMLYNALTCPKQLIRFTAEEGAEEHCHEGNMSLFHQRLFDWLDETLVG